ncbi:UvrD-helicase domain-containing protein [Catellatospora bangladeshensis]|uniref:DNA 3'-5' helicase n=1 Tax=Catellatospora bangladeshensis TaxID=310355 RepID=A0A8J3JWQ2_9ACTN|nr:UvrD-helicase domain-containing protein [Catellatospora bangladeshensis]GIF86520.1 DNA helicase [Catellatospora bangladeshensis]
MTGHLSRRQAAADRSQQLIRDQRDAHAALAPRFSRGADGERQVATTLMTLTRPDSTGRQRWFMLIDRAWPGTRSANVDMILIGPPGVFVIDAKEWTSPPQIHAGVLCAGLDNRQSEIVKVKAMIRPAQHALARKLHIAADIVHPVLAFAGHSLHRNHQGVLLLGMPELRPTLTGELPARLNAADVGAVHEALAEVYPAYEPCNLPSDHVSAMAADNVARGLFDPQDLVEAVVAEATSRSMERWMTFLHPSQLAIVKRTYTGPARISGPAGTGKTVVGLWRAVEAAKSTTGPVLVTSLVRMVPRVQARLLQQLRPDLAHRIECVNIHKWAADFLAASKVKVSYDPGGAENEFSRAWLDLRAHFSALDPLPLYWRQEIDTVIKGRGLTNREQYRATARPGRRRRLTESDRDLVWRLYEQYQQRMLDRGILDSADLLLHALAQVRLTPPEPAYGAVIVDEVQDLSLTALRLVTELAPSGSNGLLLIGDCRQKIYPGGYRLSEAGLSIVGGRNEVLTVNYRNAPAILDAALDVIADQRFEDIDGAIVTGRPADLATRHGAGRVIRVAAQTSTDLQQRVIAMVRELTAGGGYGEVAVLCFHGKQAKDYASLLRRESIPVMDLDTYAGDPDDRVKVGTWHKAKGLEFAHVLLPDSADAVAHVRDQTDVEAAALARHALHVAMSRARETLWLGDIGRSQPTTVG